MKHRLPKAIREALFDQQARKGKRRKGVVPPHLRRFLFKKGHRKGKMRLARKGEMSVLKAVLRDTGGRRMRSMPFDPAPPARWLQAMTQGLMKTSDIPESEARVHARRIWEKMPSGDRRKARWDAKAYDLPLPLDRTHRGGIIRVVKPFNLAEAQIDVSPQTFEILARTGIFQRMRRGDGTIGLVKRAKSNKGNVNIFVDRRR